MPINYSPSLDLPPELQELLAMPPAGMGQDMGQAPMQQPMMQQPMQQPMMQQPMQQPMPNYADGGMVGADGMPVPMGMPLGAAEDMGADMPMLGTQDVDMFAQQNPQAVQEIAAELQQMIQTGELSPQQLQMGEQLATTALNDPETYPQLREFAIQQGLVGPEDMPPEYDDAVLFAIVLAARAVSGAPDMGMGAPDMGMGAPDMGMGAPDMGMAPPPMNMRDGGYVTPGSNASDGGPVVGPGTTRSDSIPVNVSAGEYVIPAHVVQMKGKEFFDKMLENYKPGGDKK